MGVAINTNALTINKEWNLKVSAGTESELAKLALKEFYSEFERAIPVDESWINKYRDIYYKQRFYSLDRIKDLSRLKLRN